MRFIDVTLKTAELDLLKHFYKDVLQVPVVAEGEDFLSLRIGETKLTFEETPEGRPFYHFAFNIPENRFREAKAWIAEKTALNTEDGEDETNSTDWNAHSVYFEDPAGNILELIARHSLNNASDRPFDAESLLCVSEVGIVKDEVPPFVDELVGRGFQKYREGGLEFVPVGDEYGLLIVVKKDRRWFFAKKTAEIFPVKVHIQDVGVMDFC
ncbi:ring-cleaving dioxygenase [Paenibacillus sp. VCA1]|uniref:VOC family protein n=1 Tax=Paenibacillus sp. VCA1 TaxID=3039148 RepID=UPI00287287ED|nr:ring-cleaving dioxygenase [Paenibacillus sp. VCA1]MDR9853140.1 ring-cleaving dioxygenase [Paenibacillus sp. VCA1]